MKGKQHVEENEDLLVFQDQVRERSIIYTYGRYPQGSISTHQFCITKYSAASLYQILNMHHMAYLARLLYTCIFNHLYFRLDDYYLHNV